jgi:UDP-N-acetylmuramate--alanine ligase
VITDRIGEHLAAHRGLFLPMFGEHNVQNALAAIAVAHELMGIGRRDPPALAGVQGREAPLHPTGEVDGITVIDDYGHHPVEIAAVLKAARSRAGDVIAVVQPHRYSRLHDLFEDFCTCFNDADAVVVADVYAAGESRRSPAPPATRWSTHPARARPSRIAAR